VVAKASDPGFVLRPEAEVFATYAGSGSCRDCHRQEYDSWRQSHHGLAERAVDSKLDGPAFVPGRTFDHGSQKSSVLADGTGFHISSKDLTGRASPQTVVRVIGVDPLRQFLVTAPDGRLQTMEASYDPGRNQWFDVYGNEDRQPGEWGHWTGRGMTWNVMCAACHNTRVRKNYDESSDSYHTAMAEITVSCEACHGPMKAHAQWQQHRYASPGGKDAALKPPSRDQVFDTCASCHSRRGELTGDFAPGDSFFDHYILNVVNGSEVYYPDGQVHEEDYELAAFLGSKMHAAGVRCVDCHDSHSGQTLLPGDSVCMRCHTGADPGYRKAPVIDPAAHTFHHPQSSGSRCVNCHMPQTTYMQRHSRHDHGFTTPDPLLTRQLGVPNACNRCHADKDAQWSLDASEKWYGSKLDRPSRHRAQAIGAARRGEVASRPALLALLGDSNQPPYWKASATELLAQWTADPAVRSALLQLVSSDHPMVREAATRALAPVAPHDQAVAAALQGRLADPSRNVRVMAADALRETVDPTSPAGRELLRFLDTEADQPAGQLHKAMYAMSRQDVRGAAAHLQRAIALDPRSAALRREVAVAYGTLNLSGEALTQIRQACQLEPDNAEYQYLLGLSYAEVGRIGPAAGALERAVQLDPRHARAWYNLGLVRRNLGQSDPALQALRQAEAVDPSDADFPYARATILAQLGRTGEARAAAQHAVQLRPDFGAALQLLNALPTNP
jgi:tetratricopeptide (TPR) repeat protein